MKKNHSEFLPLVTLIILNIILFISFYGKFGDLIIDSGREVTVPWRILCGQVIYKDFFYEYGPIVPYIIALLYKIFGVRLIVIQSAGLAVSILVSIFIYQLSRIYLNRFFSLLTGLMFIFVFAFQNYFERCNIFTYIFPYSFTATFAVLFLLILYYSGYKILETGKSVWVLLFASFFALCCLTKMEIIGASSLFVVLLWIGVFVKDVALKSSSESRAAFLKNSIYFFVVAGMILVPVWFYLSRDVNLIDYARKEIIPLSATQGSFLGWVSGTDHLKHHLKMIFYVSAVYALLGVLSIFLDFVYVRRIENKCARSDKTGYLIGSIAAMFLVSYAALRMIGFMKIFFALNLFCVLILIICLKEIHRGFSEKKLPPDIVFYFCLTVSAMVLFSRKFFNLDASHYGFYYLVAGLIVLLTAIFGWIPRFLNQFHLKNFVYYSCFSFFFVWSTVLHFNKSLDVYKIKEFSLETGKGLLILKRDQHDALKSFLEYFKNVPEKNFNLLVVPEGHLLNFLVDSPPVSYYPASLPSVYNSPGKEDFFIEELKTKNIRYVAILTRWTGEYGHPIFGYHYLKKGYKYIKENYKVVASFGPPPFNSQNVFGILLFEKKS